MPKRNDPMSVEQAAEQARHRPDRSKDATAQDSEKKVKRDDQEQVNVLIEKGLRLPFKHKAEREGTTMSELVEAWVRAYLNEDT